MNKSASCTMLVGMVSVAFLMQSLTATSAQTVLDTVTLYQEPSIRPNVQASDAEIAAPLRATLRYLPATAQLSRLDGEWSALEWPLVMTAAEAHDTTRFRLAYQSAASVLPDISRLSLSINGTLVGRAAIAAPGDVKPIELAIARNVLREGANTIRLVADHRHRVDCSVEATYELWSDIDPSSTGFVVEDNLPALKLADLAALRVRADGALVIRVRVDGPMSPARVDQTIRAAQALALIGNHQRVVIALTQTDDATDGITLAFDSAAGPRLAVRQERDGAAPTLMIAGATDADAAKAVDDLVALAPAGTARTMQFKGGETRNLLPGGEKEIAFSGHFVRLPIAFDVPADFLPADYAKMTLDLIGTTAKGLAPGAQLQIRLNGFDAGSVPLTSGGGAFRHRNVAIPVGGLKPGRNTIEIAARLSDAVDAFCDSNEPVDAAGPKLTLSAASTIHMPALARIGQLPSLSQLAAGGFPFAMPGSKPKLYVPSPDRETIAATMTIAVQLAIAARHPIMFETVIGNPADGAGHGLVVAPARALDPKLLVSLGVKPEALRQAWQSRADAVEDSKSAMIAAVPAATSTDGAIAQTLSRATLSLRGWFGRSATSLLDQIDPATSLIVAQGFRTDDSADAITLVTAPNAQTLRTGIEAWTTPVAWSRPSGRATLLDTKATIVETVPAGQVRFVETQTASLGNSRLVVAGWLSIHPAIYTLSALLLAAVLACATRLLVKNVGRRNAP